MPPKSTKSENKEKARIAEDKTFGMKNKNKSKVVQKYIKSVQANVTGHSGKKEQENRAAKDDGKKEHQNRALMAALFNQQVDKKGRAYDPAAKKQAKQDEEDAIAAGKKLQEETKKIIVEGIGNTIRLTNPKGVRMSEIGGHPIVQTLKEKLPDVFKSISLLLFIKANDKVFWVDDPEDNNPTIRCQEDVDAEVAPDERSIEEILQDKLKALPPGGTPVTLATFQAWKEKREADRLAQVMEDQKNKKKGTKAAQHSAISGRDLFTFDASLFVDDDGAVSADEYDCPSDAEDDEEDAVKPERDADDAGGDDEEEEEFDEAALFGGDAVVVAGARGSKTADVAINKDLFLAGGDLPDDLDDLDDD
jgi:hypothetical protein